MYGKFLQVLYYKRIQEEEIGFKEKALDLGFRV
jgi:hypothetical protein